MKCINQLTVFVLYLSFRGFEKPGSTTFVLALEGVNPGSSSPQGNPSSGETKELSPQGDSNINPAASNLNSGKNVNVQSADSPVPSKAGEGDPLNVIPKQTDNQQRTVGEELIRKHHSAPSSNSEQHQSSNVKLNQKQAREASVTDERTNKQVHQEGDTTTVNNPQSSNNGAPVPPKETVQSGAGSQQVSQQNVNQGSNQPNVVQQQHVPQGDDQPLAQKGNDLPLAQKGNDQPLAQKQQQQHVHPTRQSKQNLPSGQQNQEGQTVSSQAQGNVAKQQPITQQQQQQPVTKQPQQQPPVTQQQQQQPVTKQPQQPVPQQRPPVTQQPQPNTQQQQQQPVTKQPQQPVPQQRPPVTQQQQPNTQQQQQQPVTKQPQQPVPQQQPPVTQHHQPNTQQQQQQPVTKQPQQPVPQQQPPVTQQQKPNTQQQQQQSSTVHHEVKASQQTQVHQQKQTPPQQQQVPQTESTGEKQTSQFQQQQAQQTRTQSQAPQSVHNQENEQQTHEYVKGSSRTVVHTDKSADIVPSSRTPASPSDPKETKGDTATSMTSGTEQEQSLEDDIKPLASPPLKNMEKEKEKVEIPVDPETQERIRKGEELYQEALELINSTEDQSDLAYKILVRAAYLEHPKSMSMVSFSFLFGDKLPLNLTGAHDLFTRLADQGDPRGQAGLGFLHATGVGSNSSQAKALVYYTFSALGGDAFGQMMMGYRFWSGVGVAQNCETAMSYYKRVASKVADNVVISGGNIMVRVRLFDENEDPDPDAGMLDDDLIQYYQFLADKGDVTAQVGLGQLNYQGGRGVLQNHQRAFEYFTQAAESGDATAQAYLGKMYSEGGPLVKQDNATALKYFKKAADQNNPIGQSGLGLLYLHGQGVERDHVQAFQFFQQAADQGYVDGQLHLGTMYYSGLGVKRDYKMAVKYFNHASQSGHILGIYNLAQMHATGTGVMRSCHTAVELYKNVAERGEWSRLLESARKAYVDRKIHTALLQYSFAAELGYEVAQSNVAYLLDRGEVNMFGFNETYQRALLNWQRAAAQGYTHARVKLGDYHYYGYGTDVDYEAAALHYRLAFEQQHNAQAMFNLGYMHEQGLGLKKDIHLAKRFYDMAAEASPDAYVPVMLALMKLGGVYAWEYMQANSDVLKTLDMDAFFGQYWDVYIITALLGLNIMLGVLVLARRHYV
ncbi:protein sel-1 homolog 1 isoform X2 [Strongylocentrotus purpuratus]|uniref:Uncharacterized protein n=1 Tax=Strongylocentrotus purpuratus TaxID=7668 RepID=A0A7M7GQ28_STRPU|nr:protein sel-1 homolog 1 isoform X2 [Strongylocentrotus purpuratus]